MGGLSDAIREWSIESLGFEARPGYNEQQIGGIARVHGWSISFIINPEQFNWSGSAGTAIKQIGLSCTTTVVLS
ncbi:MAG: hypothetical protein DHS20C16_04510 [Phycisphaerae bacterium]|nr:MAG: hypothetical protein DHS20C16_04510 [Phycisphaerae bacterium]